MRITNKDLKKQVVELQSKVDVLTKENAELKARLTTFEKMPAEIGGMVGTLWATIFPPHQAGQK